MDDIPTETCARCEEEFDIDERYYEITVVDHPHPEDVAVDNGADDKTHLLCGVCGLKFPVWLDPEADSKDDLYDDSNSLFDNDLD